MNAYYTILKDLHAVGFATKYNFMGLKAKTKESAIINATIKFNKLLNGGFIKEVRYTIPGRLGRREQFYTISPKGAKYIGEPYRNIDTKSSSLINIFHESAKIDIALSFIRLYRDHEVILKYDYIIEDKQGRFYKPDIFVTLKHKVNNREYSFLVEIERRKHHAIKREKYPRLKALKPFKDHTKILIVYVDPDWNVFLRPQMYEDTSFVDRNFKSLLNKTDLPNHAYRLMPFYNFYRLHETVWFRPDGERIKLIN